MYIFNVPKYCQKKKHFVKIFLAAFIHSAKYLLVTYWMSGIVLGTENTAVNKADKIPSLQIRNKEISGTNKYIVKMK